MADNVTLAATFTTATTVGSAAGSKYCGFSLRATADAVVNIRDGSVTGKILEALNILSGQSVGDYYENGIWADGVIYMQVVSGTVVGTIRYQ